MDNPFALESGIRSDSVIANALSGMGEEGADRSRSDYVLPFIPLRPQERDWLIAGSPFLHRCVFALPDSANKNGWNLSFGDNQSSKETSQIIAKYKDYHKRLKTQAKIYKADYSSRLQGGACILLNVDDGRHYSQPIDKKNIKSLRGLIVRDSTRIRPNLVSSNMLVLDPIEDVETYWLANTQDSVMREMNKVHGTEATDYLIHRSRVLRFDGILMSDDFMINNQGWGASIVDSVKPSFSRWDKALSSIAEIVETASILTYSLEGLSELIKGNDEKQLAQRFRTIKLMLSVFRGIAIDGQSEKIDYVTRTFNGLEAVANTFRDVFVGASGQMHNDILGDSAGGLGSTGELEQKTKSSNVAIHQQTRWLPALQQIDELIFLAKDGPTSGEIPEGIKQEFLPWLEESEEERKAGRSTDAQTLVTLASSSLITPEETRTVLGDSGWWPQLQLDKAAWDKAKKAEEEQAGGGDYDFSQYQQPTEEQQALSPEEQQQLTQEQGQEQVSQEEAQPKQDSAYSDINLVPPLAVKRTVKRTKLPISEEAKKLILSGKELSPDTIRKLKKDLDQNARKTILYLWLKDISQQLDEADESIARRDSSDPIKKLVNWKDLSIGVTHEPGSLRFGRPMSASYGHVRGTYGQSEDGKSLDVYLGDKVDDSSVLYKVRQLNPDTGELDEHKYFLGFNSPTHAKETFCRHAGVNRFGGVESCQSDDVFKLVKPQKSQREVNIKSDSKEPKSASDDEDSEDKTDEDWLTEKATQEFGIAINDWQKYLDKSVFKKVKGEDSQKYKDSADLIVDAFDEIDDTKFTQMVYENLILSELAGRLKLMEESQSDTN